MSNIPLSSDRLRAIVLGYDRTLPRVAAMAIVRTSDLSDKEQLFAVVLENEHESPIIRSAAAISLGRIMTPEAEAVLIRNTRLSDRRVLADVVKALGRIGGSAALVVLETVVQETTGSAAEQARFAAALISHRLGAMGNDLPVPTSEDFLLLPSDHFLPIQISPANEREAELSLRTLKMEPLNIVFAKDSTYQIRCGQSTRMIMLNQDFTGLGAVKKLMEKKAFLGIVATKFEESQMYATSFFLLTSPIKELNRINILIYRSTGALAFGGTAQITENSATFTIHTVSRPGANPVQIEGTFTDGRLTIITALAASFTLKRRQPKRTM